MTASVMFHDGNRRLQDDFDSRRIADRLEEKLTRFEFTDGDRAFEIPSGWQIAPDETDIRWICGHHKWRSDSLVLDDGSAIFTCCHAGGSAGVAAAGLWLRARARSCV